VNRAGGDRGSGPPTILVVEDNFFLAEVMRDQLVALGYRVLGPAPTVGDALALLDPRPAAGLLDINLGGELVTPVADRLLELGVPFGFVSAYTDQEVLPERFTDAPFHAKPLSGRELEAVVESLLAATD